MICASARKFIGSYQHFLRPASLSSVPGLSHPTLSRKSTALTISATSRDCYLEFHNLTESCNLVLNWNRLAHSFLLELSVEMS
jgi:hypothetical protein